MDINLTIRFLKNDREKTPKLRYKWKRIKEENKESIQSALDIFYGKRKKKRK